MISKLASLSRVAVVAITAGFGVSAQAGLIGDTIGCTGTIPSACSAASAVVGAGIEFTLTRSTFISFSADFDDTSLTFTDIQTGVKNLSVLTQFTFTGLTGVTGIASLGGTNTGWTASMLGDTLTVNLQSAQNWAQGRTAVVNFAVATVPEPSSLALVLAGLALGGIGLGVQRRRAAR